MALQRGHNEPALDYINRCLQRAKESRARAEACENILMALRYRLEDDPATITTTTTKTVTKLKFPFQIRGGYHGPDVEELVLGREERKMMRFYFDHEKHTALLVAEAYEKDATQGLDTEEES